MAEKDDLLSDKERLESWKMSIDIAQLQFKGMSELQDLLRKEEKARKDSDARFELMMSDMYARWEKQYVKEAELQKKVATLEERLKMEEEKTTKLNAELEAEKASKEVPVQLMKEELMAVITGANQALRTETSEDTRCQVKDGILEMVQRLANQKIEMEALIDQSCKETLNGAETNCKNMVGQHMDHTTNHIRSEIDKLEVPKLTSRTQALETVTAVLEPRMDRAEHGVASLTAQLSEEVATRETLSYTTAQFETKVQAQVEGIDSNWKTEVSHLHSQMDTERKSRRQLEDQMEARVSHDKELTNRVVGTESMVQTLESRADRDDTARKDLEVLVRSSEISNQEFMNVKARLDGVAKQANRHDIAINSSESKYQVHSELLRQLGADIKA